MVWIHVLNWILIYGFSFITLSNFNVAVSSVYKRDLTKVSFVSSSVITTSTPCSRYTSFVSIWVLELELSLFLIYIYSAVQRKSISPSNWSRFYKPNWFGMAKVGWGMLTPSVIILILAWDQNLYWSFSSQLTIIRLMEMGFFLLATSHHLRLKRQEMIHGMNSKLWRVLLYV